MEGEKIFFKKLDDFTKDNNINKNIFYKKKNRFEDLYEVKIEELKKDNREKVAGHPRNKDYRINKIYEPLIALMFNVFQNNKIKTKFSDLKYIPLNRFLNYIESNIDEIDKLPSDIYTEIVDNPTYEYNYTINEYMRIFLEKIETIINTILSFDVMPEKNTLCDVITKLNDIIDLLNNDYEELNKLKIEEAICSQKINAFDEGKIIPSIEDGFKEDYIMKKNLVTEKIKYHQDFKDNPLLDDIIKNEFNRLNNLYAKIYKSFKKDIKNKPSIYSTKKSTAKNEPFYSLNKNSKREELFSILKNDPSLFENLITSLKPKQSIRYINNNLYKKSPEYYSLTDFINIYKLDAYIKLKRLNLECINDNYFKLLENLSANIDLAKEYISKKIFYSSKMTSSEFFKYKEIMYFLYKSIISPDQINLSSIKYNNIQYSDLYNLACYIINETELIKEIKIKNNPDNYTYCTDVFLQLYTNDNIINLFLNNMKFNKCSKLEHNNIVDLSSGINISLDRLTKNKTDLSQ